MALLAVSLAGCAHEAAPAQGSGDSGGAPGTSEIDVEDLRVEAGADRLTVFFRVAGTDGVQTTVRLHAAGQEVASQTFDGPGSHAHAFLDLMPGASLEVTAVARDGDRSAQSTVTVQLPVPPDSLDVAVLEDAAEAAGAGAVRVSWRVAGPAEATSHVRYGEGSDLGNLSASFNGTGPHELLIDGIPFDREHGFQVVVRMAGQDVAKGRVMFLSLLQEPAVIEDVRVSDVTQTEATVHWRLTDGPEGITSRVVHGEEDLSDPVAGLGNHSIRLVDLPVGSPVPYRIVAYDGGDEITASPTRTFRTASDGHDPGGSDPDTGDEDPPVISQLSVEDTTQTTATIRWHVQDASSVTSRVAYGDGFAQTSASQSGSGTKEVTLTGLASDTTYAFRVEAEDSNGLDSTSASSSFTTAAVQADPLQVSAVSSGSVVHDGFTVQYTVDGPSGLESRVEYGTGPSYGASQNGPAGPGTHTVVLSGLLEQTAYHFRVVAQTASDSEASSDRTEMTAKLVEVEILGVSPPYFADDPLAVPAGVPLQFRVTNSDGAAHTWEVVGQNHVTPSMSSGQTHTFTTSIALTAGAYEQRCTIHPGMLGDIDAS